VAPCLNHHPTVSIVVNEGKKVEDFGHNLGGILAGSASDAENDLFLPFRGEADSKTSYEIQAADTGIKCVAVHLGRKPAMDYFRLRNQRWTNR
jgi:hypothetical protein